MRKIVRMSNIDLSIFPFAYDALVKDGLYSSGLFK